MKVNEIQALWLAVLVLINAFSIGTFSSIKRNNKIGIITNISLIIIWIIEFALLTYFAWFS